MTVLDKHTREIGGRRYFVYVQLGGGKKGEVLNLAIERSYFWRKSFLSSGGTESV